MSANLEGRIQITMRRRDNAVVAVNIHSSRPQAAQRLLVGCSPVQAAERVGLLFSVCGRAQRVAGEMAIEAAQGTVPDIETQAARQARVVIELILEHAWRLCLDWPKHVGLPPEMAGLLALRASSSDAVTLQKALRQTLAERLLGGPPAEWLEHDVAGFEAWRTASSTTTAALFAGVGPGKAAVEAGISQVPLLPPLQAMASTALIALAETALSVPAFCAQPVWQGQPIETGAIARQIQSPLVDAWVATHGRGAGARMLARLVELAALAGAMGSLGQVVRSFRLADDIGLAGVETSRGVLFHVVRLADGKVADYRIIAPTEWNFHPAGTLAEAIVDLSAATDLLQRAREAALSLDPCVEYVIDVEDM